MSEFNVSSARQPVGSVGAIHAKSASRRGDSRIARSEPDESPPTVKRKSGRLDDSLAAPVVAKRRTGGQPGNKNARKKPDQTSIKKRGAPRGNQNARTHGFYARRLPQSQLDGLEETTVRSLEDEIGVMRVFSRKVAELGAEVDDLDEAKSLLNTLANATGSINRLVRTHTHIPDPHLDPQWMLRQALLELQEEWPELKRFANDNLSLEEISELDAKIAINAARERQRLKREFGYPGIPDPDSAAPPTVE